MGMTCTLRRATAVDIARLRDDPSQLSDFLDSIYNGPRLEVEEVRPPGLLGFLLRLTPIRIEQVKPHPEGEVDLPYEPSDRELDLEIYPDVIWGRAEGSEGTNEELAYLIDAFRDVRQFLERAAEADDGLLVSLS
jgi:hypothetical protein